MQTRVAVHLDLRHPREAGAGGASLDALIERAAVAEAGGVDVVWLAERPTEPGAAVAAALPMCAAIAARTTRLRVGTAVLPLPLHHPVRVAEDAATLDLLSGGRLELGVGLGSDPGAMAGVGIDAGDRAGRLEEAIALMRAAWGNEPLAFRGRHFTVEDVAVHPKPVQAGGPPLWVGARAEAAQRRAARLGCGLIVPAGASVEAYLETWRSEQGGEGPRLAVLLEEPETTGLDATRARVEGIEAAGVAQLDLVIPVAVDSPAWPEQAQALAASLAV